MNEKEEQLDIGSVFKEYTFCTVFRLKIEKGALVFL